MIKSVRRYEETIGGGRARVRLQQPIMKRVSGEGSIIMPASVEPIARRKPARDTHQYRSKCCRYFSGNRFENIAPDAV